MIYLSVDNRSEIDFTNEMEEMVYNSVGAVLETEGLEGDYEISLSLVDANEIKELNSDYRGVDEVTDVLSFPMDMDFPMAVNMLGDVIINVERVKSQADDFGHSFERELSYLTVHSVFHLLGYDHIDDEDKLEMRAREKLAMKYLGVYRDE